MVKNSATGMKARIVAVPTFPAGFDINQWADDADPFDSEKVELAGSGIALNGDLVVWSKASKNVCFLRVLAGTEEAKNLDILLNVNRTAKGKTAVQDKITLVVTYADGTTKTGLNGAIISGPTMDSGSSEGRLKTREYEFHFENVI